MSRRIWRSQRLTRFAVAVRGSTELHAGYVCRNFFNSLSSLPYACMHAWNLQYTITLESIQGL